MITILFQINLILNILLCNNPQLIFTNNLFCYCKNFNFSRLNYDLRGSRQSQLPTAWSRKIDFGPLFQKMRTFIPQYLTYSIS